MSSLYTKEISQYLESQPWPKKFAWAVGEGVDRLWFVCWAKNIDALSGDEKMQVYSILKTCLWKISASGIPIYTDKRPGDGTNE